MAYRPPEIGRLQSPRVESLPHFTKINLDKLTSSDTEQLIRAKLAQLFPERSGGLPKSLVEPLTTKAQGNPFFIEELLNYMRDRDISPYDEQALKSLELPSSLHTLVLSRMDQLTESQKVTLKVASIIGRLFPFAWLQGYYPALGQSDGVKADLHELARLDLAPLDTPEPELSYLFKHIVTQEAAYESLAYATRAQLHEQLAQFLEAQDASKYLDLLAFHYGRTENAAKQREYLRKAGKAAQAAYANEVALNYYDRLLPLLTTPNEQIDLQLKRGEVLLMGRWDEAETAYRSALGLAEQSGDAAAITRCQHAMGELSNLRGDFGAALACLGQARAGWEVLGETEELGHTLATMGQALWRTGEYVAAKQALSEGLALARTAQDRAFALLSLGGVAINQGDLTKAHALTEEALAQFRQAGHKWGAAAATNNLGLVASNQGDYATARVWYEESLALCREIGDKQGADVALENLGMVAYGQGNYAVARALYEENLTLSREIGDKVTIMYDLIGMAGVATALGEDMRRAAQLAGAAEALRAAIGLTVEPLERGIYERAVAAAQAALGEEAFAAAFAAGQQMTLDEAVSYALEK